MQRQARFGSGWNHMPSGALSNALEFAGLELVGIYHSHPNGPDRPSPTDIAGNMYPVAQLIWFREKGRWQARGYNIENGISVEIPLEIQKNE